MSVGLSNLPGRAHSPPLRPARTIFSVVFVVKYGKLRFKHSMSADAFASALELEETHFAEGHQQGVMCANHPERSIISQAYLTPTPLSDAEPERGQVWWKAESWACRKAGRLVKRSDFMLVVCRYATCFLVTVSFLTTFATVPLQNCLLLVCTTKLNR